MNTQTFLSKLEQLDPNTSLVFQYGDKTVAPGYHVTEIMNALYESVDCGGQANVWRETIVQLQGPRAGEEAAFMTVKKFLSIYGRVTQSLAVHGQAELRLEYGDSDAPALRYHITAVDVRANTITVSLTPPGVTCKALGRAQIRQAEVDKVVLLDAVAPTGRRACC